MKAVLISIRPEWCDRILNGEKTIEVRKTLPKLETPFKCYIYCTKALKGWVNLGTGQRLDQRVVAEFTCNKIERFDVPYPAYQKQMRKDILERSCVPYYALHRYTYHRDLFAWDISDLKVYDKPKCIYDFYKPGAPTPEKLEDAICDYCEKTDYGEHKNYGTPNGPVMCEGAWCGEAYEEYLDQNFMVKRAPQSWCYVEELSNGL